MSTSSRGERTSPESSSNPPSPCAHRIITPVVLFLRSSRFISHSLRPGIQLEVGDEFSREIDNQDKPQLQKCKTNAEPIRGHILDDETRTKWQEEPNDMRSFPKSYGRQPDHFFSSKQLNSCIIASEPTRAMCSLMIALLVVLSYVDYPLFGWKIVRSESFVASRPLYILLLMDVTIVMARAFYKKKKGGGAKGGKVAPRAQNWQGVKKLLERGLVAY